jgi:hypothetical protein
MTATNTNGSSNTQGLLIETRRVYFRYGPGAESRPDLSRQIFDMPALDAICAVREHPSQYSFSPWPGGPTELGFDSQHNLVTSGTAP